MGFPQVVQVAAYFFVIQCDDQEPVKGGLKGFQNILKLKWILGREGLSAIILFTPFSHDEGPFIFE